MTEKRYVAQKVCYKTIPFCILCLIFKFVWFTVVLLFHLQQFNPIYSFIHNEIIRSVLARTAFLNVAQYNATNRFGGFLQY